MKNMFILKITSKENISFQKYILIILNFLSYDMIYYTTVYFELLKKVNTGIKWRPQITPGNRADRIKPLAVFRFYAACFSWFKVFH